MTSPSASARIRSRSSTRATAPIVVCAARTSQRASSGGQPSSSRSTASSTSSAPDAAHTSAGSPASPRQVHQRLAVDGRGGEPGRQVARALGQRGREVGLVGAGRGAQPRRCAPGVEDHGKPGDGSVEHARDLALGVQSLPQLDHPATAARVQRATVGDGHAVGQRDGEVGAGGEGLLGPRG